MFDVIQDFQASFGDTISPPPYKNQLFSDSLDPFNSAFSSVNSSALSTNYDLGGLQITSETDSNLIPTVQEAAALAKDKLTGFALQSDFYDQFGVAFGDNYSQVTAESIHQQLAQGNLSQLPEIKVISSDILGSANGAYANSIQTIFLSDKFVLTHNTQQIAGVLTEEIGHYIDSRVNTVDSPGDEGEIFGGLVQGRTFSSVELARLKSDDDSGFINFKGQSVAIESNDSIGTAEWLGNLGYSQLSRSGWVGGNVPNDFYRFTLNNSSNVDFYLTGLGADVDLYLLNSSGQTVLSKSDNSGTSNENINVNLAAGQYYLKVNRWSGDSRNSYYNLSMVVDGAGDSIGGARDIGTLNSSRSYSDWVGVRDANDYYRFSIGGQSNFSLSLTGLSADADVILLNSSGGEIRRSANSGSSSESINTQLGAGTYYVQVNSWNGNNNTNYNLSLNATPIGGNSLSGLMATSSYLTQLQNGQLLGKYSRNVDNAYGAQCWDLVADATGINGSSPYWNAGTWRRGESVIGNNVAVGTAIATFAGPNNSYYNGSYNHCGIFAGYETQNGVSGFYMWEQNTNDKNTQNQNIDPIRRVFYATNGYGVTDADNYFIIRA